MLTPEEEQAIVAKIAAYLHATRRPRKRRRS